MSQANRSRRRSASVASASCPNWSGTIRRSWRKSCRTSAAYTGAARLTGSGQDVFKNQLKEIQSTAADTLQKVYNLRIESNAEQVLNDLNKIHNALTVDIGSELAAAASSFFKFTGGVDTTIDALKRAAPVAAAVVAALTFNAVGSALAQLVTSISQVTTGLTAASRAAGLLKGSLGALVIGAAVYEGISFLQDRIKEASEAAAKDRLAADKEAARVGQDSFGHSCRSTAARRSKRNRSCCSSRWPP